MGMLECNTYARIQDDRQRIDKKMFKISHFFENIL